MTPPVPNLEETTYCSTSSSSIDDTDQLESFVDEKQHQDAPCTQKQTSKPSEHEDYNTSSDSIEPIVKTTTVIKEFNNDEPLPVGWLKVVHYSGMPVYLHRESRVCTMSRPYYLGEGSVRKHEVPISAIPCLEYSREKLKAATTEHKAGGVVMETVEDHKREKWLKSDDVREYCEKLFEFDEVKVRKFKKWADRQKFNATVIEEKQRPPDDVKLVPSSLGRLSRPKRKGLHTPPLPVMKSQEKSKSIRTPEMPKLKSNVYRELKF